MKFALKEKARLAKQTTRDQSFYKNLTLPIWGHNKKREPSRWIFFPNLITIYFRWHDSPECKHKHTHTHCEIFYVSTRVSHFLPVFFTISASKAGDRWKSFCQFPSYNWKWKTLIENVRLNWNLKNVCGTYTADVKLKNKNLRCWCRDNHWRTLPIKVWRYEKTGWSVQKKFSYSLYPM